MLADDYPHKSTHNSRILIVDEDPLVLQQLHEVLTESSYRVHMASDAATALDLLAELGLDLILLDINLPDMDGFSLCQRLKTSETHRDTPVIFLGKSCATVDKIRAFAVGGEDYVCKPVQYEELLARIEIHLRFGFMQKRLSERNERLQQELKAHTVTARELAHYREQLETLVALRTEQLSESEAQYSNLFNQMQNGFLLAMARHDEQGELSDFCIKEANSAFLDLVGRTREEVIGASLCDVLPEGERLWLQAFVDVLEHGKPLHFENYSPQVQRHLELVTYRPSSDMVAAIFSDVTERKAMQVSLARERDRAQHYLDTVEVMLIALDLNGRVTLANRKACAILGYEQDELIGKDWIDLCIPDSERSHVRTVFERLVSLSGPTNTFNENNIITRRGDKRLIAWHNSHIIDPCGEPIGLLSSGQDITEQKRAEVRLRKSETRYRTIIDTTSEGFLAIDQSQHIVDVNDALSRMLGYSREAIIGQFPHTFSDGDELKQFYALSERTGQQRYHFQVNLTRHDGQVVQTLFHASTLRRDKGELELVVAFITDISERTRVEEALRRSEEQLRSLINNVPDIICFKDGAGRWLESNYANLQLFGLVGVDYHLRSDTELMHDSQQSDQLFLTSVAGDEDAWNQSGPLHSELLVEDVSGESHTYDMIRVPIISPSGERNALVVFGRDITQRKQDEERLREAKNAAEAANRAKSTFLANMSHELRTPLNAILGYTQLFMHDDQLGHKYREGINIIHRSGHYLLTLLNDVLDLAKIEAGRFDLVPAPCELIPLIEGIVELFRMRARQKDISFRYQSTDSLPSVVMVDEKRLRQILLNLLSNAVKFTEQGSVELVCDYRYGELWIRVSDTGVGISHDDFSQIFIPFQQAGSDNYKAQGTGLGLAITHKLVELMDGQVEVDSELGKGSRFELRIPMLPAHLDSPAELAADLVVCGFERVEGEGKVNILLVDDNADNRTILRHMLEPLGFALHEARDGVEALEQVQHEKPDLVLMDLVMPRMTGLDATRALHSQAEYASLPIVAVSASVFSSDREECLRAGCVEHIAKPVDEQILLRTLGRFLPIRWIDCAVQKDVRQESLIEAVAELDASQRKHLVELAQRGRVRELRAAVQRLVEERDVAPILLERLEQLISRFDLNALRELLE